MENRCLALTLVGAFTLGLTSGAGNALADPISPGFDFFATEPGTFVNLPGIGRVDLIGRPIGPGNTDTIVQRHGGLDPFPIGGSGTIEIELVGLSLQSVAPVSIGGDLFDVSVTQLPSPRGSLTAFHDVEDGGTFDSVLPVNARLTFTPLGPGTPFFLDVSDVLLGRGFWSHTPAPGYPDIQVAAGGFFPGVVPGSGGMRMLINEEGLFTSHKVTPSVPEPSTLVLVGLGLAAIAGAKRRLSKKA